MTSYHCCLSIRKFQPVKSLIIDFLISYYMKSRIDVVQITILKNTIEKLHLMVMLFVDFILSLIFVLYITRCAITIYSHTNPYLQDL